MQKRLSWLAVAVASAWMACSTDGRLPVDPLGVERAAPAQSSSQPGRGVEKTLVACQQGDIHIGGAAPDLQSFAVEAWAEKECIVGLASYERPGGGPTTQAKFGDSGGKLVAQEKTILRVGLPCGAWQADLYFNIDMAPSVPRFHGGNLVKGWTGATSCSAPSSPPPPTPCDPPCDGRDECVNGVCVPPRPSPSPPPL